jgi:hypothetical protein
MRRYGIEPSTATSQAQKQQASQQPFEPLPAPTGAAPFRLASTALEIPAAGAMRVLHVIGDSGGVQDPKPQGAVASALIADLTAHPEVAFLYHVGDVDYFNGARAEYVPQFFEAYAHYVRPILAIPGNHDGDPEEGSGEASLSAFVRYFCAKTAQLPPEVEEYNRDTMTQPNVYWTLTDELVTIVGLYSNVPQGGQIEPEQAKWLSEELAAAAKDRALIVALHHPPYSADAMHGGSAKMGQVLDAAFASSGRTPDLVITGHVHNFQRFTRTIGSKQLPYIVCGAGGYHNLHAMATGAKPGLKVTEDTVLEAFDATQWGFLRLTVSTSAIEGEYVGVASNGTVKADVDHFTVKLAAA